MMGVEMRFLMLTGLVALLPLSGVASVRVERAEHAQAGSVLVAQISGEITDEDFATLSSALDADSTANAKVLMLDSIGGNLFAAMDIGRLVRKHEFTVAVLQSAVCLSSCVLILAAGVEKNPQGDIGIHRPYFPIAPVGQSAGEALRGIEREVSVFLEEMNIPVRLAEDMFSIEPADMKVLSREDLSSYRLNLDDYAYRENKTLEMMETLGKSRTEYEAFRSDLNYSCAIYRGMSAEMMTCTGEVARRHGIEVPQ